jgi:hypothetical protein
MEAKLQRKTRKKKRLSLILKAIKKSLFVFFVFRRKKERTRRKWG